MFGWHAVIPDSWRNQKESANRERTVPIIHPKYLDDINQSHFKKQKISKSIVLLSARNQSKGTWSYTTQHRERSQYGFALTPRHGNFSRTSSSVDKFKLIWVGAQWYRRKNESYRLLMAAIHMKRFDRAAYHQGCLNGN